MTADTPVGTLYDPTPYDVLQDVEANRDGIHYSIAQEVPVAAGDTLVNVALVQD